MGLDSLAFIYHSSLSLGFFEVFSLPPGALLSLLSCQFIQLLFCLSSYKSEH